MHKKTSYCAHDRILVPSMCPIKFISSIMWGRHEKSTIEDAIGNIQMCIPLSGLNIRTHYDPLG